MTTNQKLTPKSGNLQIYKSDGTPAVQATAKLDGFTLASATTYYAPLGSGESPICAETFRLHSQIRFSAALVAAITLEATDFPLYPEGVSGGPKDVDDIEASGVNWIGQDPDDATVEVVGTDNAATGLALSTGGTHVGAFLVNVPSAGARRYRWKIVVTTGGACRVAVVGKD